MRQENRISPTFFSGNDDSPIFDSVHNIFIAIDSRGRIKIFNTACEKAFNITSENAVGRLVTDVVPYTGLIKVLKTGKSHIGRKFLLGNTLYVANRTPIIKKGAIVGAVGVAQEASEIQQLAEERDFYKYAGLAGQTVMQESQEGYLVIDSEGYILFVNNTLMKALELEETNAVGRHVTEIIPDTGLHLPYRNGYSERPINIMGKNARLIQHSLQQDGNKTGTINRIRFCQDSKQDRNYRFFTPGKTHHCRYNIESLIGCSSQMEELKNLIRKVGKGPSSILITGESGTGKELVAQGLHTQSPRKKRPFIKVNCAALPENLLESELFGYREGAFTGARKGGQKGKFELAQGGTILLDEIGDMPLSMQAKLLRVLQEKEIERLGDSKTIPIDVRIIASTNQDVVAMVTDGAFRQDLFYRLNVINICLPPLRERMDDLDLLVDHFIDKFNLEFTLAVEGVSDEVWRIFTAYEWPGNVRELENILERAFNLVEGNYIEIKHLPHYIQKTGAQGQRDTNHLPVLIEEVEKKALTSALSNSNGNKAKAAKELGISRAWLYKKLKYYNIQMP